MVAQESGSGVDLGDGRERGASLSNLALQRMAALLERLAEHPRIDHTCEGVANLLQDLFGFPYIEVFEVDRDSGVITPRYLTEGEAQHMKNYRGRVGEGILGHVASQGRMILISDAGSDPRFISFLPGSCTELAVPIRVDGQVRYILNVESDRPGDFDQLDRGLIETLAGIIGAGFRLVEEAERREVLSRQLREERNAARDLAAQLRKENLYLKAGTGEKIVFQNLIGVSPSMQAMFREMEAIRDSDATVLINGATGSGKEIVARTLHQTGPRRSNPFVTVNAANLQEQLFESELFGYVKGAFSGANSDRQGLAQAADGGTLFLDEVGELSLEGQAKLLRFLDFKEVRPLGSTRARTVDVRIIAATNRTLEDEVGRGAFRQDLFYRLRVIQLRVPSLAERREDLPLLILHFLKEFTVRERKRIPGLTEETMDLLLAHSWDGNVRELKNQMERVAALTPDGEKVRPWALAPELRGTAGGRSGAPASALHEARKRTERQVVIQALEQTGWNVTRAARILGISRVGLSKKIKRLGLKRPGGLR